MLFSHPYNDHERSSRPVRPVPHENLFLEPRHETAPKRAMTATRSAARPV